MILLMAGENFKKVKKSENKCFFYLTNIDSFEIIYIETIKGKRGFSSGRPRKSFAKEISFIQLDDGKYKLSGRGRPNPNQKRTKVTVHFSWLDSLTPQRFYTKKDISKMTKVMP